MKIAVIIVRTLVGLMFLFSSVVVLFNLMPHPELKGNVKVFMEGIVASVYLMPLIKITELVCAIALLTGRYVALALVVLFPIIVNIVFYHSFLGPADLPVPIALLLGILFLAYTKRESYKPLFAAK
ncbi:DoxX family protein [Mucilaginibacter sabulilitoris]|uniref:DoxX family protein n=1 Tax=Mucilaginibacter sabulilitoris TaxID=1173583 RepID=A0ABZ0TFI3_9SPHI|nr:DoxX family protein [Mucilaginibacter sabulilitoris]WPU91023.1 DoxX family protein [Mucilaginibacter sabulilitoris]